MQRLDRGTVTESRRAAMRICEAMRDGSLLDSAFEKHVAGLDVRDRRWLQQLVFGMLRTRSSLDALIESRVTGGTSRLDPTVEDLLRLGLYQLLHMNSVPAYAAIAQTVELAKQRNGMGASKLVNAILRRVDRERKSGNLTVSPGGDPLDDLAIEVSHPRWLIERWIARYGEEDARRLLAWNNSEAPVYVRAFGVGMAELDAELTAAGAAVTPVPDVPGSMRMSGAASLTELGAFRKGWFFVQDPAATLVTDYAAVPHGATVADLCAPPGGKAIELSRRAGVVFAGDRSADRLARMQQNLARLHSQNVYLFAADARVPPLRQVDFVLLDAPCTGTGTFRRHPDARWRMKASDVTVMAAVQHDLLAAAASIVRPGGLLVYSTCSLEPEENDAQIDGFLAENADWRLDPPAGGVVTEAVIDQGKLRVLPHRHGFDGAFAARLRKAE